MREREKDRGIERGNAERRKRRTVRDSKREKQLLNKRYHHHMDSCNVLLVHHSDLFGGIQGFPNALQEVPLLYSPSPGYP